MTQQNKTTIKSYFETGDKPTQAQFIDFIDSYVDTSGGVASDMQSISIKDNSGTGSKSMGIVFSSTLSVARNLTFATGDASRTITVSGNPTLNDWFDQSVKVAATPTFNGLRLPDTGIIGPSGVTGTYGLNSWNGSAFVPMVNVVSDAIPYVEIRGATNDSPANAGFVGQIIESNIAIGSAISLTNNTPANITSISLTAGDWDVWGNIGFIAAAGTIPSAFLASISQTSATHATSPNGGGFSQIVTTFGTASTNIIPTGVTKITLASTTTIYLVATAAFSVSTLTAYGYIGARRRR